MESRDRPSSGGGGFATWPVPAMPTGGRKEREKGPQENSQIPSQQSSQPGQPWTSMQLLPTRPGSANSLERGGNTAQWPALPSFPQHAPPQGGLSLFDALNQSVPTAIPRPGSRGSSQGAAPGHLSRGSPSEVEYFGAPGFLQSDRQPGLGGSQGQMLGSAGMGAGPSSYGALMQSGLSHGYGGSSQVQTVGNGGLPGPNLPEPNLPGLSFTPQQPAPGSYGQGGNTREQAGDGTFGTQRLPGLKFLDQPHGSRGSHAQQKVPSGLGTRTPSSPELQLANQRQGSAGSHGNNMGQPAGIQSSRPQTASSPGGPQSGVRPGSSGSLNSGTQRLHGVAGPNSTGQVNISQMMNLSQMLQSRPGEESGGGGSGVALVLRRDAQDNARTQPSEGQPGGTLGRQGNAPIDQQQLQQQPGMPSLGAQQPMGATGGWGGSTGPQGEGPPGGGPQISGPLRIPIAGTHTPPPQDPMASIWPGAAYVHENGDSTRGGADFAGFHADEGRQRQWPGRVAGSGGGFQGQGAQPSFPGNFFLAAQGGSSSSALYHSTQLQGPALPGSAAATPGWQLPGGFSRGLSGASSMSSPSLPQQSGSQQRNNGSFPGWQLPSSSAQAPLRFSEGEQQALGVGGNPGVARGWQLSSSSTHAPGRSSEAQEQPSGISAAPSAAQGWNASSSFSQGVLKQLRTPLAQAALSASQALPDTRMQPALRAVTPSPQGGSPSVSQNGSTVPGQRQPGSSQAGGSFDRNAFLAHLQRHWQEERHPDYLAGKWSSPKMPPEDGGGAPLDLAALFEAVSARGGYEKVTRRKWWRSLALDCLGGNADRLKLGHEGKCAFEAYLKSFADRYFDASKVDEAASDEVGRASMRRFPPKGQASKKVEAPGQAGGRQLLTMQIQHAAASSGFPPQHRQRPAPTLSSAVMGQATQQHWHSSSSSGRPPLQSQPLQVWHTAGPPAGQLQMQRQAGAAAQNACTAAQKRPASVPLAQANAAAKKRKLWEDQGVAHQQQRVLNVQQQQQQQQHFQLRQQQQQHSANQAKAQNILSRIAASPGPVLAIPARLDCQQVEDMAKALDSGVDTNVAWALNALSLASFSTAPDLMLAEHPSLVPALVRTVQQGLPGRSRSPECAVEDHFGNDCGPSKPGKRKQSDIWAPKGWWWECEGLFSDEGLGDERLTWAVCASNVLRNLAAVKGNEPYLARKELLGMLVECLEARCDLETPPLNELVSNLLELLRCVSRAVLLPSLQATGDALVAQLSRLAEWGRGPLRMRTDALCALITLVLTPANMAFLPAVLGGQGSSLVDSICTILTLDKEDALVAARAEAGGGSGDIYVPHSSPSEQDLCIAARVLKAEVQQATLQATAGLMRMSGAPGDVIKHSFISRPAVVQSLVHLLTSSQPSPDSPPVEAALQLPQQLQSYTESLESQVLYGAVLCLLMLKSSPQGAELIKGQESKLAMAAMYEGPAANHMAKLVVQSRLRS